MSHKSWIKFWEKIKLSALGARALYYTFAVVLHRCFEFKRYGHVCVCVCVCAWRVVRAFDISVERGRS